MIKKKNNNIEKEVTCPFCNTEFYYTEEDLIDINEKEDGFICPECGFDISIRKRISCKFPESFFHFGISGESAILTDEETQKYIDKVKNKIEKIKEDEGYTYIAIGDTIVLGFKYEGIYYDIYVAKNYWSDSYCIEE